MSFKDELPKIVTGSVPGPASKALLARWDAAVPKALDGTAYPICLKRGEGAMFEDLDGNKFLDWIGGVGVLNIGYSRPELVAAVKERAEKFFHGIFNDGYVTLAEGLNRHVPCRGAKKKTFFADSGAECDENAIKVAKAYTKREGVICFTGAFHGRTNLTMALTAKKSYARGMGPFPASIYRAPYPYLYRAPKGYSEEEAIRFYIDDLNRVFDEGAPANEIACMIVEPLQGEGGFIPAPIEWVKAVRRICDDNGILLIADEVQCGNCRTGKYFASEYWADAGCAPDIVTTAKSIAGGMPLSAIMDSVPAGVIGGTYCGNPVSCAAGIAAMKVYDEEDFPAKARYLGELMRKGFTDLQAKYSCIGDVRGLGAMIGVEFVKDPVTKEPDGVLVSRLIQAALQKDLLMENAGTDGNVIRFLAPLVMTDAQTKEGPRIFETALQEALQA